MPVNLAMFVFSQSWSVFLRVVSARLTIISLMLSLSAATSPLRFDRDGARQVALGHGGRHVGDRAHLRGEVGGQLVDVIGQIAPDAGGARHQRLAAELAFDADFAGDVADLVGEDRQGIDHAVDGFRELGDFALGLENQFALQVAVGNSVTTLAMPRT